MESFAVNFESVRQQYLPLVNATKLNFVVTNSSVFKNETVGYHYSFDGALYRLGYNQDNNYTVQSIDVVYGLVRSDKSPYFGTLVVTMDSNLGILDMMKYNPWNVPPGIPILLSGPHILLPTNVTQNIDINKLVNVLPPSPLEQSRHGVSANDIDCFDRMRNFELFFKAEDKSPACMQFYTASNLIKRGWAMPKPPESVIVSTGLPTEVELENKTLVARVPLYIEIKNFQHMSPSLRIQVTYPNGTSFKTEEISSTKISSDGHYTYDLTISSLNPNDVFGRHRIYVSHDSNSAEVSVLIPESLK